MKKKLIQKLELQYKLLEAPVELHHNEVCDCPCHEVSYSTSVAWRDLLSMIDDAWDVTEVEQLGKRFAVGVKLNCMHDPTYATPNITLRPLMDYRGDALIFHQKSMADTFVKIIKGKST